ncbi:phosphodiester glycosidase family protein [Sporosarcina highlanderae]|uniref:Phosphodiester glycosidase family protein n=1 Tax=Sporosarcina highlanderae TaxID=3035916 RepID=A0ABT8JMZ1_9BACL|nr:phosphodiester glycosidase family protein [Sporosarcina highlanderae]MDN4605941.1 phosphodiester glycosidase family protein [Sporosarcina highlanderae]
MHKRKQLSKLSTLLLVIFLLIPNLAFAETSNTTAAPITESTKISQGVHYEYTNTTINNDAQAFRQLIVDLNDPFTTVDVSYPTPLNKLTTTTSQANAYTALGQQVAGAVNGSFFWGSDQGYLPMYLIAYRDRLMNAGIIASGRDQYVNQPIAFGIDSTGKGKIDSYNLSLSFNHNGQDYPITSTDKHRSNDNLILYTPLYPKPTTETNALGIELVLEGVTGGTALNFGETVTGKVMKIRERNNPTASTIPKDGFVLSAHGEAMQLIKDIGIGETISITANIDEKWKGASFMLTSGPELVKEGKVNLGIDPNSDRATERAPRTAIAIDKTGTKVFMVTVDGRQSGYSRGQNMKEFAEYLVSIGAYQALNLDGGGSTTMAVRKPGDFNVSLFNKPSDGRERSVSTALFAVSKAPAGTPTTVGAHLSKPGVYLKGTKGSVLVDYVMDNFYNPVTFNKADVKLSSPQGLITVNGLEFTAQKAGAGAITAQYSGATASIPFEVVESIHTVQPSSPSFEVRKNGSTTLTVKAFDAKNREVIFDPALVKWSAPASIGTITAAGVFTAASKEGTGVVTATLGGKTVSIPVTITGDYSSVDKMESLDNWTATATNGKATLSMNSDKEPAFEGNGSLKLTYDFTGTSGTSAAYLDATNPVSLAGTPVKISARVYGDAGNTWLRGRIQDGQGKEYVVDFTPENGLKWLGWNYVTAAIPAGATGNLSLKQIYIAQPTDSLKTKGSIRIDDLKSVFANSYKEALFKDTGLTFRAEGEITALVNDGVIAGFADGRFGPYEELTRQQAAILLARALKLPLDNVTDPGFEDMAPTMTFYKEVAAVANYGIIQGKEKGKKFDPNGKLTRAEMAAILQRGFKLPLSDKNHFTDSNGSFAKDAINSLAYNNITQGIGGGKYGPAQNISRADFSVFLHRTMAIK